MKKSTLFLVVFILISTLCHLTSYISFAQYTKLHDFSDTVNGRYPIGSLVSDGTFFYGTTWGGGTDDVGVLFKIKPDGTGYSKLLDFSGIANGSRLYNSLISDGIFLYGMTHQGGTNDMGVLFKIKSDGTGYSKLIDFAGISNGSYPTGSLISDSIFLYGMTYTGGTNDIGVVFKIKRDGTGYTTLLNFAGTVNGRLPAGSLISDSTFLYGMTRNGGIKDSGTVFKIKFDGTGYVKLLDFSGATNGSIPMGSLVSDGNFLYGMTTGGGINDFGTVFKIKHDGTGYAKLLDFSGANGGYPAGSLIFDGPFLYGMTWSGGTKDSGTVFKIKPDGTEYATLLDFSGATNGSNPYSSLISDGTFLYGTTHRGGTNHMGTIFKYGFGNSIAENNMENNFSVYPNPTSGKFTIQMGNGQLSINNYQLSIYNVYGEKVYDNNHLQINSSSPQGVLRTNLQIDLSSQPKGMYFIKVNAAEGQMFVQKVVLQ